MSFFFFTPQKKTLGLTIKKVGSSETTSWPVSEQRLASLARQEGPPHLFKIHSGPEMAAGISGDGGGVLEVSRFFFCFGKVVP